MTLFEWITGSVLVGLTGSAWQDFISARLNDYRANKRRG